MEYFECGMLRGFILNPFTFSISTVLLKASVTSACSPWGDASSSGTPIVILLSLILFRCEYCGTLIPAEVESLSSLPAITSRISEQPLTLFENIPIVSNDDAKAVSPYLEILPYVGLNPATPQKAAGCLTEPPVSVPSDAMHIPAATATALPPDEPPETRDRS